ncbi:MAG TPA: ATP-binding protein, partial [Herpetosiphonaceae bacterium]
ADELLRADHAPAITVDLGEQVDLAALAGELAANLGGRAARGGVDLAAEFAGPLLVSGSRDRLKQALLNLLDNALRSTPPGGAITISGGRRDGRIELLVRDTGPGVPPALREAVWERGVRGADGGSGLGLAIVKAIAEAHGGAATLLPAERGAAFLLRFPPPADPSAPA